MTEQTQTQEYRILYIYGDNIVDNGTRWANSLEDLQADFPNSNWAIIPVAEVPADWQDMTIVDGELVLAPTGVI